jgi:RNA polymerase sigma factor (TIGR02999 family)
VAYFQWFAAYNGFSVISDGEAGTNDITSLLDRWSSGDVTAFDEIVPLVYDELRRLAFHLLSKERPGHTLQCTALVHEAYLRLVKHSRMRWNGRAHFFGAAAHSMRRVLVEHARQRLTVKRGGGAQREPIDCALTVALEPDMDVIALDDAITDLASVDRDRARVVEMRYFGGLTIEEIAEVLGVSPSSVSRDWTFARAWLFRRLNGGAS